jgi:hypothetical protein
LAVILTISNSSYSQDFVHLQKDDKAPYEGLLFSIEKSKELRIKLLERDYYESANKSLTKIVETKDLQMNMLTERNNDLAKNLSSERTFTTLERMFWFTLGVVGTIGAALAVKRIAQ